MFSVTCHIQSVYVIFTLAMSITDIIWYVMYTLQYLNIVICTLPTYQLQQDIFDIRKRNVINVYQYALTYIVTCEIN